MIEALLGPVIDIHGGGADLVFPHHENELAQSAVRDICIQRSFLQSESTHSGNVLQQAACGCGAPHTRPAGEPLPSFARFWMHNGFVNVDSEKMSKCVPMQVGTLQGARLTSPLCLADLWATSLPFAT